MFAFGGGRYFIVPNILWMTIFLYCLGCWTRNYIGTAQASLVVTGALIVFLVPNFSIPALTDNNYAGHVKAFLSAEPGTVHRIPINPAGWGMLLRR